MYVHGSGWTGLLSFGLRGAQDRLTAMVFRSRDVRRHPFMTDKEPTP